MLASNPNPPLMWPWAMVHTAKLAGTAQLIMPAVQLSR